MAIFVTKSGLFSTVNRTIWTVRLAIENKVCFVANFARLISKIAERSVLAPRWNARTTIASGCLFDYIDLDSHLNLEPDIAVGVKMQDGRLILSEEVGHGASLCY